jgi:hypothetical protein
LTHQLVQRTTRTSLAVEKRQGKKKNRKREKALEKARKARESGIFQDFMY